MLSKDAVNSLREDSQATRFHTHILLHRETLGHHQHGVALLLHILHPSCRKELLVAALIHDQGEGEFGDTPGHTKRILGTREATGALETKYMEGIGLPMPELTPAEKQTLKFADSAHGAFFCLDEMRLGSRSPKLIASLINFVSWLENMRPSCVPVEAELLEIIKREAGLYEEYWKALNTKRG